MPDPKTFRAHVVRVIDGDTIRLKVDVGFYLTFEENFRLLGLNTPEIRGPEKEEGLKVKAVVEGWLPEETAVRIETTKAGKYGRWLTKIWYSSNSGWVEVNQKLLDLGLATAMPS